MELSSHGRMVARFGALLGLGLLGAGFERFSARILLPPFLFIRLREFDERGLLGFEGADSVLDCESILRFLFLSGFNHAFPPCVQTEPPEPMFEGIESIAHRASSITTSSYRRRIPIVDCPSSSRVCRTYCACLMRF